MVLALALLPCCRHMPRASSADNARTRSFANHQDIHNVRYMLHMHICQRAVCTTIYSMQQLAMCHQGVGYGHEAKGRKDEGGAGVGSTSGGSGSRSSLRYCQGQW
ncbi:hypothetical protein V8C86DRAFT_2517420 [Haematococcus lacustris]